MLKKSKASIYWGIPFRHKAILNLGAGGASILIHKALGWELWSLRGFWTFYGVSLGWVLILRLLYGPVEAHEDAQERGDKWPNGL